MNRKRLLELAGINEEAPGFDKKTYDAALDVFADQVAKEFISYVRQQWEENRQQYESGFPSFKEYLREIQEDPSQYAEHISGHIADQLYERSNFYLRRYLRAPDRAFVKE